MKTNKYEGTLLTVSPQLLEAYEKHAGVNLKQQIEDFGKSQKAVFKTYLTTIAIIILILAIVPWRLTDYVYLNFIPNWIQATLTTLALTTTLIVIVSYILGKKNAKTYNTHDEAEWLIENFERAVESLDPISEKGLTTFPPTALTAEKVWENIVAMAEEKLYADGLAEFIERDKNSTPKTIQLNKEKVISAEQTLENALASLPLFGLSYSRSEVFKAANAEAEKIKYFRD